MLEDLDRDGRIRRDHTGRVVGSAGLTVIPDRHEIDLAGRPQDGDTVVFRPAEELMSGCANVYEEWCPNSNLFSSRMLAEAWAAEHQLCGRVLSLEEASDLAANEWQDVVRGLPL